MLDRRAAVDLDEMEPDLWHGICVGLSYSSLFESFGTLSLDAVHARYKELKEEENAEEPGTPLAGGLDEAGGPSTGVIAKVILL